MRSPESTFVVDVGAMEANMELSSVLSSDGALLVFVGLGLIATGVAIVRDIPVQRRAAEEPVRLKRAA